MQIGAFEAKNRLGPLLDLVEAAEEVTITRHSKEVARVVPAHASRGKAEARAASERRRPIWNSRSAQGWR